MIFGGKLSIRKRQKLAPWIGSACVIYVVRPSGKSRKSTKKTRRKPAGKKRLGGQILENCKIRHQIESSSISIGRGKQFQFPIPEEFCKPDTSTATTSSKLTLLEDGVPLRAPHSLHTDIEELGKGRYSHWGSGGDKEVLYFSSSDGSDPRTNGKIYAISVRGNSI
jgi:hypothetical protein